MSKMVDERNRVRMVKREVDNDHHLVTVAFHGEEDVPVATHLYKKSPLNLNKAVENKSKPLNNNQTKQATSDEAQSQKIASSMKVTTDGTFSRGEALSSAVIQAEGVRSKLNPEFPSFVKSLVRSHVASCFWMGLPVAFCKKHLPDKDTTITLEDDTGKEYKTKYIACKTGLSAGWRQFSAVHKLQEGDVVVFQLVEPNKFKVYIIRANNMRELGGTPININTDSCIKQKPGGRNNTDADAIACNSPKRKAGRNNNDAADAIRCNSPKRKQGKSIPLDVKIKKQTIVSRMGHNKARQSPEPSENDSSEDVISDLFEGFKMPDFKDLKGFENFRIIVDGMPIDDELSTEVRNKYYKLCYSQQAFIHENLIKGMNYNLIAGIISETVHIADAIKISVISTPRFEFSNWDKTLLAFGHLGMNVEFLRVKLRRLVSLAYETDDATETRRYLAYRTERSRADDEIKNMESKLEELKEACSSFGAYLENLKCKAENYHHKFHKEVAAPW